jgi:hypothetical protein
VIGGSLETNYTENLEGDVIARNGNVLTLTNSTLAGATCQLPQGYFEYITSTSANQPRRRGNVMIGPATVVTAEGNASLPSSTTTRSRSGSTSPRSAPYTSEPGIYTIDTVIPTTGSTAGQVRLQSTQLFGQLQSAATGSLTMNLQTIDNLPASLFNFAGDGTGSAETRPRAPIS